MEDFFRNLNSHEVKYVVLRNYEEFFTDSFLQQGHADIDLLCSSREALRTCAEAEYSCADTPEAVSHCKVRISGTVIPVDLRETGDGYYCTKWEEDMLANRRMHNGMFYVMDEETYFYSLVYHALIHKYSVSPDYAERFKSMAQQLGLKISEDTLLETLERYMLKHGYTYTYPESCTTVFNTDRKINRKMLQTDYSRLFRRRVFALRSAAKSRVKAVLHTLLPSFVRNILRKKA